MNCVIAFAWADEPSALSVPPPLGHDAFPADEVEPAEVLPVVLLPPVLGLPLELHAASVTVPAATSAAIVRRRFRLTGFSIR
jgi:hypothetical protein